ncbi:DUF4231 domain-containing protein [Streptomyces sp. STR69]|uniref:DUF4231 domain-containing protein n=1 Tax=Streptomyces sp. STR69 TaxID=1796942 RepID=UPI0021C598A0|nr:DUF4231 domain-containing protein [Streptomyces sp. STR69]
MTWQRQRVWSHAATRQKKSVARARLLALGLSIVTAISGTASAQTMDVSAPLGRGLAFVAALAGAATPLVAVGSGPGPAAEWVRLRAISEALKSDTYRYLAGVSPFRGPDRDVVLQDRLTRLERDAADLVHHTNGTIAADRPLPDVRDVAGYAARRPRQQMDEYYVPQALRMRERVAVVRRLEVFFSLCGAALGATAGAFAIDRAGVWVAVCATMATAVTAHGAASKYGYQELEYTRTANELRVLLMGRTNLSAPTEADEDAFVAACEDIISVQNDAWMVKWTTA